ncbi:F-box/RNI-like superfamily protein [Striga asiatica]|uniref:F-box/RNI-like superfamily protein n=1 Tax=Striga asiatica TaxID=4170 RepID=A0A5A7PNX9_STRAF|nr:F-box/RNI-like superfamily protein [Striga asiatica]
MRAFTSCFRTISLEMFKFPAISPSDRSPLPSSPYRCLITKLSFGFNESSCKKEFNFYSLCAVKNVGYKKILVKDEKRHRILHDRNATPDRSKWNSITTSSKASLRIAGCLLLLAPSMPSTSVKPLINSSLVNQCRALRDWGLFAIGPYLKEPEAYRLETKGDLIKACDRHVADDRMPDPEEPVCRQPKLSLGLKTVNCHYETLYPDLTKVFESRAICEVLKANALTFIGCISLNRQVCSDEERTGGIFIFFQSFTFVLRFQSDSLLETQSYTLPLTPYITLCTSFPYLFIFTAPLPSWLPPFYPLGFQHLISSFTVIQFQRARASSVNRKATGSRVPTKALFLLLSDLKATTTGLLDRDTRFKYLEFSPTGDPVAELDTVTTPMPEPCNPVNI